MSLSRDSRAERKLKAIRRAQFRLGQSLERIDWEEDSLLPEIEALKSGKSVLGLPEGSAFDIVIDEPAHHANPDPAPQPRARIRKPARRRAH
jgi:hypothetical protein